MAWILWDTLGILFASNAIFNCFNVYVRGEEHLEWSVDSDTALTNSSQVFAYGYIAEWIMFLAGLGDADVYRWWDRKVLILEFDGFTGSWRSR
jgi:hypothetical protein